jgi:hypothetical protein
MNAAKLIRTVRETMAEFALHMTAILAIVGVSPISLDSRVAIALLHSVAVMFASNRWPTLVRRYLLVSTGVLVTAYCVMMYLKGPALMLARTLGLAN